MDEGSQVVPKPLSPEEVAECNRQQMDEMDKHKYLESEKAERDLGKAAHADWVARHAKAWREAWIQRRGQDAKDDKPDTKE